MLIMFSAALAVLFGIWYLNCTAGRTASEA